MRYPARGILLVDLIVVYLVHIAPSTRGAGASRCCEWARGILLVYRILVYLVPVAPFA